MENRIIISIVAILLIVLMSFNLITIYNMNSEIMKLQHGQVILSEQIK